MRAILTVPVVMLAMSGVAGAQAVVTGTVREDSTGRALAGVEIIIERTARTSRTDAQGRYSLVVDSGRQVAVFRQLGYKPARLWLAMGGSDTALADVRMQRQKAAELAAVEVTARPTPRNLREAMFERQRLGFGKFLDSAQLRRMDGRAMPDVLRGLGLRLQKYADADCTPPYCPLEYRATHPTKTLYGTETPCYASVMYDGIVIYRAGSTGRPPDFSREFPPYSLAAIEYYRSTAQLPQEFGVSAADCGVVVLWSRRG
jgi:hypothetical protein